MSTSILRSSSDFHHFLLKNLVHHARKLRWFGINNPEAILDQVRGWPQATSFLDKHGSNLGKRERVLVVRQVILKEPLNPLHRNLCISNLPYFINLIDQGTNFRVQTKHACSIFLLSASQFSCICAVPTLHLIELSYLSQNSSSTPNIWHTATKYVYAC
uniref:Uncharacterized protein n=1 Tax=Opuntia streptacantha TaxID=393608 RepID=A0A7C9A5M2_OPUST